jgi:hypothetical protein
MYQNGKIYKLVSDSTDKIYIGSTCNPLYKRLGGHKTASKNPNKCFTSKELVKFDDCKIILIEDFPCERKEQLTARERYHIEQNKDVCVNKAIPTRTSKEILQRKKEWYEQNKDKKVGYDKEYYNQNKDKIAERRRLRRLEQKNIEQEIKEDGFTTAI